MKVKVSKEFKIPNTEIVAEKNDIIEIIDERATVGSLNDFLKSLEGEAVSLSYEFDTGKVTSTIGLKGEFNFKSAGLLNAFLSVSGNNQGATFSAKDFSKNVTTEFDRGMFALKLEIDKQSKATFNFIDYRGEGL